MNSVEESLLPVMWFVFYSVIAMHVYMFIRIIILYSIESKNKLKE